MQTILARNVNQALTIALRVARDESLMKRRDSRNGPVVQFHSPVGTSYSDPEERVLTWAWRDANPFFHLLESVWMLAGRADVAFPARYVERMRTYSDDGEVLHGAYGRRWRDWFPTIMGAGPLDQVREVIAGLRQDPNCRRQVIQMWDPETDLGYRGADAPCNLTATVQVSPSGHVDMTVFCRSNDVIWGAYGANAVHFSMLQEYVAAGVGRPVGELTQVSVNWHAYLAVLDKMPSRQELAIPQLLSKPYSGCAGCPYVTGAVKPYPLFPESADLDRFDRSLRQLLDEGPHRKFEDPWVRDVAAPMALAHEAWVSNRGEEGHRRASEEMHGCAATDWYRAGTEWLDRRMTAWERARDDGPHAVNPEVN